MLPGDSHTEVYLYADVAQCTACVQVVKNCFLMVDLNSGLG